ncbi:MULTISPECIES: hypothetical protein [unclassified Streptomyces]|uniref:hypothetical protein n=1 Tax=unclassified Streptomyces TaxID=2593676 RepID=UPI001E459A54|nr:hypothetical protein [Streptomyces sp. CB02980]MCB8902012.1 hypothetical protein [Streptomyces sp. CB02980]
MSKRFGLYLRAPVEGGGSGVASRAGGGDDHLQPVTVGLIGWNATHGVAVPAPRVVIGSLVSVVPLFIAFRALQRFWRAGMTARVQLSTPPDRGSRAAPTPLNCSGGNLVSWPRCLP